MGTAPHTRSLFYCGTSNVVLPVPNKAFFPEEYQDKTRLAYYSLLFNTVEINSTFYRLPKPDTIEKWSNEVSDDFVFTFKLWRQITHNRELLYDTKDIVKFLDTINRVGDKKGCLLVQFPTSISIHYFAKLKQLLADLYATGRIEEWKLAIEFRHGSWYNDKIYEMLEDHNAAIVQHDMPKSATLSIDMHKHFSYIRFHGEKGDYKGSYTMDLLNDYASYIQDDIESNTPVFVYFNNTIGDAVHNALALQKTVWRK